MLPVGERQLTALVDGTGRAFRCTCAPAATGSRRAFNANEIAMHDIPARSPFGATSKTTWKRDRRARTAVTSGTRHARKVIAVSIASGYTCVADNLAGVRESIPGRLA